MREKRSKMKSKLLHLVSGGVGGLEVVLCRLAVDRVLLLLVLPGSPGLGNVLDHHRVLDL